MIANAKFSNFDMGMDFPEKYARLSIDDNTIDMHVEPKKR